MPGNPHDALFKAVFGEPEHARGALRAALPVAVAEALDWSSLARCPGSFVDPALRERHTDLLFSAVWRDGGETLLYLLFEHQSSSDGQMAFRLLRYLVRIWERWNHEHPGAQALPVVVPVVLYHGASPWSAAVSLEAMFEMPEHVRPAISPYLVRLTYLIDDLSEIPDRVLRDRAEMTALAKLVELCFKHARTRSDLVDKLGTWADMMREVVGAPHGLEALARVMRYILLVSDHVQPEELQALLERAVGPDAKDTIMTAGERLIQQGLEQGIQQGIQQGIEQGILQGERAVLLRQLRRRFGAEVDAGIEQRLAGASVEQLEAWAERVLSAATLADLFAD